MVPVRTTKAHAITTGVLSAAVLLHAGCASPKPDLASPVSSLRIQAAASAAASGDQAKVGDLISLLASDDPAVRLVAIRSLERLTGQTLGYRHHDPEPQRRIAIQAWNEWQQSRAKTTDSHRDHSPSPDMNLQTTADRR
jgi:HEAT repeat protein